VVFTARTLKGKKHPWLFFLCCLGFIAAYKLTLGCFFNGTDHILLNEHRTHYGGVKTGAWIEFIQTEKETCGHSTAALFNPQGKLQDTYIKKIVTVHQGNGT
jgi:hypothetical protein